MNLPANFFTLDCETSGLSAERHALLSIGAVTASGREFYREVLFDETKEIEPAAMAVNGFAGRPSAADAVFPEKALSELLVWLREEHDGKWIYGGKNPKFDYDFLDAVAKEFGALGGSIEEEFRETISRRAIDLHSLAYWWALQRGMEFSASEFTTDKIYAALGFAEEPKPHHALTGAKLEMAIFRDLASRDIFTDRGPTL